MVFGVAADLSIEDTGVERRQSRLSAAVGRLPES
jgi:hypothetical protein